MQHYVYTLAYPDGRVFYVGKGTRDRIHYHERQAKRGVKSYKCNVIRKIWTDGGQVVKQKLAYFETHEEACMYEIGLIFFMNDLTNQTIGGDGSLGELSEEHRHRIGEAHRGRKRPGINVGRKLSEKIRRKIAEAHRGKPELPRSEETRQKLSEALRGKPKKTHCSKGHPFEGENLILVTRKDGRLKRCCRECKNAAQLRAYYKRRNLSLGY